jgi:hypothetical protein
MSNVINYCLKVWRGNESLAKTFWLFAVIGEILVVISADLILMWLIGSTQYAGLIAVLLRTLHFLYAIFFFVATWRSSERYEGSILWIILVRLVTIFALLWAFYGFFIGFGWILVGN